MTKNLYRQHYLKVHGCVRRTCPNSTIPTTKPPLKIKKTKNILIFLWLWFCESETLPCCALPCNSSMPLGQPPQEPLVQQFTDTVLFVVSDPSKRKHHIIKHFFPFLTFFSYFPNCVSLFFFRTSSRQITLEHP